MVGSPTFFFFFNDTATTEIYTLSLHDALPIFRSEVVDLLRPQEDRPRLPPGRRAPLPRRDSSPAQGRRAEEGDRKSTRLNSSHSQISYAVFCLKKKKTARRSHACSGSARRFAL